MIKFYDDTHTYEYNGIRIPSVTEILRFVSRETYSNVDARALKNAAEQGTRIHNTCEELLKTGQAIVEKDIEGYIMAFRQWVKDYQPKIIETEKIVYYSNSDDEMPLYAGRCDIIAKFQKTVTIDIKSSSVLQKNITEVQLIGYHDAIAYMAMMNDVNVFDYDADIAWLHLKSNGKYKYHVLTESEKRTARELWEACLTLHNLTAKKGRKKRDGGK